MTLCLAWKRGHSISFASDSRLSGGYGINSDMATKIFKIHVNIFDKESGHIIHNLSWGMCFCGSYLNGSVVAGTVNEILSSLQIAPGTVVDAKAIIDIAFDIFKQISSHLMSLHGKSGLSRVMVGGVCPHTGEVNLYHFSWKYAIDGGVEFTLQQELFDPPFVAVGDTNAVGKALALSEKINYEQVTGYTEYHLLNEVIDDKAIHGVGGPIQTGHFINGVFRMFGMADWEIKPINEGDATVWVFPTYSYMGIPIQQVVSQDGSLKINTTKVFMSPFNEKQQELEKQAKKMNGLDE